MAATSPYQNNDYQAVSTYRPYKLPVNDILKAYVAQNQFWDLGAQRVKGAYENALNLSLVTEENRTIRDNFLKGAEKELTKLSAMNLADPSVQRQGLDLFRPLLRDEDIVGEDYVVKTINRELSTGQSFRTRDGGKQYNPLSIENIQFEKSLLSGALNRRDGWRSLHNNLSTYTPQYDTAAELKKITDLVKEQEIQTAQVTGDEWYIETINKKGVPKERIQAAIEEMGSPQLKAAMRVEGRNAYYKHVASNPDGVDTYFQGIANKIFDDKINDLRSNKADVEYQAYITGDPSKKAKYRTMAGDIEKQIERLEVDEKPKFVSEYTGLSNVDNLATNVSKVEQLWQSASINRLAPTLSWESQTRDIESNPVKIAKENNRIAVERINYQYKALAEDKRHNLATEQDAALGRMLEKERIEVEKKGKSGTSQYDPLFGTGTEVAGIGPIPTSEVGGVNVADLGRAQKEAREAVLNEDHAEPLREAVVSSLLGANAWAGIQGATQNNERLAVALTDTEIDNAAQLFKAFNDKYGGQTIPGYGREVGGTHFVKGTPLSTYKSEMKNWDVAKFKRMVGNMAKHDNEFIGDLALKIGSPDGKPTEEGRVRAARFRSAVNNSLRRDMNFSNTINERMPDALGSYSKYFENNGATLIDDKAIERAYQKMASDSSRPVMIKSASTDSTGNVRVSTREATPEETKKYYQGTLKLGPRESATNGVEINKDEFNQLIRRKTDPVYFRTRTEFNTNMMTVGLEKNPNRQAIVQGIRNLTSSAGTDNNPNLPKMLEFIESRADKVSGYNIYSPGVGQELPQIQINMSNLSDEDQVKWDQIKNIRIPVAAADKRWYQKGSVSQDYRYKGAVLSTIPINNPEKGLIKITNSSRSTSVIDPEISIDNVYFLDNSGRRQYITKDDVQTYLETYFKKPMQTILTDNLDGANEVLAYYVNSIEQRNREYNETKK